MSGENDNNINEYVALVKLQRDLTARALEKIEEHAERLEARVRVLEVDMAVLKTKAALVATGVSLAVTFLLKYLVN